MNVLFLTLGRITEISSRGIYNDLMRKFRDEGHKVYIVTPYERQFKMSTSIKDIDGVKILGVKTLNIQKTNIVEKGIGTILLETQYKNAIKKYLKGVNFDLILYSTPPITFTKIISYLKKNNPNAITYLLLKDIFPQNAVDLGMFSKKSVFYKFFRKKEKLLYKLSNYIGCMSEANVKFVLDHNDFIDSARVEVAPNSIELPLRQQVVDKKSIREKYNLPQDKLIFIYGGNLGKPQGIDFLIKCLEANKNREDCWFVVVGNGTEYSKLKKWADSRIYNNIVIREKLPKEDYDLFVQSCDVGLIFLDSRFTIPNYPSRLLSYLEYKMPIIAATDKNTDIGVIAENNNYGYWCESVNPEDFTDCVNRFVDDIENITIMGNRGYTYLKNNYLVDNTYNKIISHL